MKSTITASVISYNDESRIKQCLDSVKPVVDEIVFVRQRIDEAEPHRQFAMEQAESEWILTLDTDEYLSPRLQKAVKKLVQDNSVDGYEFYWSFYDKGRKITSGPLSRSYRLALFRKAKTTAPKKFHEWYKVKGNVKRVNLILEHAVPYDNWAFSGFMRKHWPRASYDARHRIVAGYAKWPFFIYLPKAVLWFFLLLPYNFIIRKSFLNGLLGLRVAFLVAAYNFLTYFY